MTRRFGPAPSASSGPAPRERANSLTRVYENVLDRQREAKEYNDRASKVNEPIAEALNDLTDQQLESDAKTWWDWWDNYNEMRYGDKPVVQTNQTYTFVDYMLPNGRPNGPFYGPMYGAHSCFAAGTPVWTIEGPRPIERIAVGDLVLAQDPATGELAYKAVLRTTVAPPADLVTVIAGEDRLVCTSGHCFWVPGHGWVHASKLDAPMPLHKVAGAATVSQVARPQGSGLQPGRGRLQHLLRRQGKAAGPRRDPPGADDHGSAGAENALSDEGSRRHSRKRGRTAWIPFSRPPIPAGVSREYNRKYWAIASQRHRRKRSDRPPGGSQGQRCEDGR